MWACVAIGLAGGILSGLMGVGGCIVLIPLMAFLLKMTQAAQGTSLAVICLSFVSMLIYYKRGCVNFSIAALIGLGFVAGGFLGSYLADFLPEQILKKCFAALMIIIAVKMLTSK
ncbi:MAG: sulfite exporter TauE/SafE family protein [Endomicrobium sp.]|nr:sulfite exporter TauE/SafE family protein [Endomicrobium sp.]